MKKLFTFLILACAFLIGKATVTETLYYTNFAELAVKNITFGNNVALTRTTTNPPYSATFSYTSESGEGQSQTTNTTAYPFTATISDNITLSNSIFLISRNVNIYYAANYIGIYNGSNTIYAFYNLQANDNIEIAYTGNGNNKAPQPSHIFNLSSWEESNESYTFTYQNNETSSTRQYSIYTAKVTQDGNAGIELTGPNIAYIKITREMEDEMTFVAGSNNVNETLPSGNSNVKTVTYGDNKYYSFALTTNSGQFRSSNQTLSVNGATYNNPLFMAGNYYTIVKSSNINKITLYGQQNSGNSAVEVRNGNDNKKIGDLSTDTGIVLYNNIEDENSVNYDYVRFLSNCIVVFVVEYEIEEGHTATATVDVGDEFNNQYIEWNTGLASGTWSGSSENPFAGIMSVTNTNSVDLGLFVSITPKFETKTEPQEWSETTGMPEWLWNQMKGIETSEQVVDGYYPATSSVYPAVSVEEETASITNFYMPCSGQYTVNIITLNPYDVNLTNGNNTINVYPSTNLTYSEYTITGNGEEDIVIKSDKLQLIRTSEDANTAILYIPGVYCLDGAYYSWDPNATSPSDDVNNDGKLQAKRKVGEVPSTYKAIDMESWNIDIPSTTSQSTLYLILSKNNVSTPLAGDSNDSESQIKFTSIPTTVEAIEAVDGPAEYFNLQGVKIANPDHGIFIKVQNGKASKVIL